MGTQIRPRKGRHTPEVGVTVLDLENSQIVYLFTVLNSVLLLAAGRHPGSYSEGTQQLRQQTSSSTPCFPQYKYYTIMLSLNCWEGDDEKELIGG